MPSFRTPPPGFGISTRNTGIGWYVPSTILRRMSSPFSRKNASVFARSRPSTPAAPLFRFTRFQARFMFSASATCSSSGAGRGSELSSIHGSPSTRTKALARKPAASFAAPRARGLLSLDGVRTILDSFLNVGSDLHPQLGHYGCRSLKRASSSPPFRWVATTMSSADSSVPLSPPSGFDCPLGRVPRPPRVRGLHDFHSSSAAFTSAPLTGFGLRCDSLSRRSAKREGGCHLTRHCGLVCDSCSSDNCFAPDFVAAPFGHSRVPRAVFASLRLRPCLATTPLSFAKPSSCQVVIGTFTPLVMPHAGHTRLPALTCSVAGMVGLTHNATTF